MIRQRGRATTHRDLPEQSLGPVSRKTNLKAEWNRCGHSTQGYRTYTYSPRGYVKLLREAGFDSVDLWWPPQGYNLPHELIRLQPREAGEPRLRHC